MPDSRWIVRVLMRRSSLDAADADGVKHTWMPAFIPAPRDSRRRAGRQCPSGVWRVGGLVAGVQRRRHVANDQPVVVQRFHCVVRVGEQRPFSICSRCDERGIRATATRLTAGLSAAG